MFDLLVHQTFDGTTTASTSGSDTSLTSDTEAVTAGSEPAVSVTGVLYTSRPWLH